MSSIDDKLMKKGFIQTITLILQKTSLYYMRFNLVITTRKNYLLNKKKTMLTIFL